LFARPWGGDAGEDDRLSAWRVGIDVGGTFTDVVAYDAGGDEVYVEKTPSERLGDAKVELLSHGTTVGLNAIIQGRGPRVGVLITDGFRDLPYIKARRQQKGRIDFFSDERRLLVPSRELIRPIPERVDRSGRVVVPLDEEAVRREVRVLKRLGVESIAICYLYSFANPAHERRTRQLIHEEFPGCVVTSSAQVMPRIREWPRFSTTILDAIAGPVLVEYIRRLETSFADLGMAEVPRYLMQANGGILPFAGLLGGGNAVYTLMSGPVAAVMGARALAQCSRRENLVVIDIGGTSCDIAFVSGGRVSEISEYSIAGFDTYFPAVDVSSIGAGGGTIVWVDESGYPHFGPRSAGADPGPACYGRGGTEPTVTDADLVLGYLNPAYFLGGRIRLHPDLAENAIRERLATALGMDTIEAARGIVRMANQRMADEIGLLVAQRGIDVRESALVAGGGAGPVHGPFLAQELGIRTVLVPLAPGAFSAMGLLSVDVAHDYVQSDLVLLGDVPATRINEVFGALQARAAAEIQSEGLPGDGIRFHWDMDIRYAGQGFELRVECPCPVSGEAEKQLIGRRFERLHEEVYGHAMPGEALEIVSYRLRAEVDIPKYAWDHGRGPFPANPGPTPVEAWRPVYFPGVREAVSCPVYRRESLAHQAALSGPAIIEQPDSTTVVPVGWDIRLEPTGIILERPRT
jgi:N-methylhydantoinase A